jgi:hypothetical protein
MKIGLPYDTDTPLLGIYPKEYKSVYKREICIPMFIEGPSQQPNWNPLRYSTADEYVCMYIYIYVCMYIYIYVCMYIYIYISWNITQP